jgi:hypothetical protein
MFPHSTSICEVVRGIDVNETQVTPKHAIRYQPLDLVAPPGSIMGNKLGAITLHYNACATFIYLALLQIGGVSFHNFNTPTTCFLPQELSYLLSFVSFCLTLLNEHDINSRGIFLK